MADPVEAGLIAESLSKAYGALKVTDDVSFEARIGERHAIIGPNGAGKTTLFKLLSGEVKPDAGRILLEGVDIARLSPDKRVRRGLGWSYQRNALFLGETVLMNLMLADMARQGYGWQFWRRLSGHKDRIAAASAVADRVGLSELLDRPVRALSYGAQRQLEVGLALMGQPRILLLDEPTSGMSPEETGAMLALIDGLPRDIAVVIVEHDMDLVFAVADRITVLNAGRVLLSDLPDAVKGSEAVRETYLGAGLP